MEFLQVSRNSIINYEICFTQNHGIRQSLKHRNFHGCAFEGSSPKSSCFRFYQILELWGISSGEMECKCEKSTKWKCYFRCVGMSGEELSWVSASEFHKLSLLVTDVALRHRTKTCRTADSWLRLEFLRRKFIILRVRLTIVVLWRSISSFALSFSRKFERVLSLKTLSCPSSPKIVKPCSLLRFLAAWQVEKNLRQWCGHMWNVWVQAARCSFHSE